MNQEHAWSRRAWLTAASAPLFVPSSVFGQRSPSNRINVGVIGVGRQTVYVNLKQFLAMPEVQVTAVCDVDAWRLEKAKKQVEESYATRAPNGKYKGCATFVDYRELLADKSIDAVMVATPDHWHVPMSIDAIKAGKDVTCEKPLTRSIAEGRALADAAQKYKRVFRTDSEFRSTKTFHMAVELVRNGRIGQLHTIVSGVPLGDVGCPPQPDMPVPPELDYERWQGPAPRAPYTLNRVHGPKAYDRPGWMRHLYYCDGMVTNWGTHLNDIAQWGNDTDRTGPISVEGRGEYPPPESFWNVLLNFEIEYKYANGVKLVYKTDKPYVKFEGSEGSVYADMSKIEASKGSIVDFKSGGQWITLPFKSDKQDFIDAVKSRGQTIEDAEVGHRTTSVCHLGHIAIQVGKRLSWDPARERFTDHEAANEYIGKPIHAPRRAS
jgi:myo-inositol 2-dehydrogenase / D-chiro-inositol 1-dehydrogenase